MKLLIALSILLLATPALGAEEAKVTIDNFTFSPATLSVKAGATIIFVNHDDLPHNVVDANGGFRSKALDTDETFARVFDKPGEFVYFCGLHPQMQGKIIVTP
jgi:plastocyanin